MQLISALVCVTLMSVAQAISLPNKFDSKPKVASQNNSEIQEEPTLKLPEGRRNFALFPRMNKKFVVTPEPRRVVSQSTKKPLMKKLVFRYKSPDDENIEIKSVTTQSLMTTKLNENDDEISEDLDQLGNDKEIDVSQNLHQIKDKESSVEIATEDFEDIQTTKKPLMKKLVFRYESPDDENIGIKSVTTQSIMTTKLNENDDEISEDLDHLLNDKEIDVSQNLHQIKDKASSVEIATEDFEDIQTTKKPLMKQLVFRYESPDDENIGIKSVTTQSVMTTKLNENDDEISEDLDHLGNDNEIDVSQNLHQIKDKESSVEIATENFEDIQTTKKLLMEKLVFGYESPDDENIGIKSVITQSIMTTKLNENDDEISEDLDHLLNDKEIDVSQNLHQIKDKASSVEIATEDFEDIQTANQPMIEENIEIEEFTLNPTEEYVEDLRQKWLLQADKVKMNDKANNIADSKEFIFLNPLKQADKDLNRVGTTEKYITIAAETDMPRVKRSDNIIEEENLGTTVSGYKFTWWDTRLTNNLAFKNINS